MSKEMSAAMAAAFSAAGLPWPAIDEDQLRAWATDVRTFADEVSDSSTRSRQAMHGLAADCESAVVDALDTTWAGEVLQVTGLHAPLSAFADVLDAAAVEVEVQKGMVILEATGLVASFVATQAFAIVTAGTDELAYAAEVVAVRRAADYAIQALEQMLIGKVINLGIGLISDHVNRFLGTFLAGSLAAVGEVQSLNVSYQTLQGVAQQLRGHASATQEAGDTAYARNADRDLSDEGGSRAGGAWAAVLRGLELALSDLAVDVFENLPKAIVARQHELADSLDKISAAITEADREASSDVPAEAGAPGAVSVTGHGAAGAEAAVAAGLGGTALTGAGLTLAQGGDIAPGHGGTIESAVGEADDLAGAGAVPGSEDPPGARFADRDPVDVVTGAVLLSATDVTLPGVLPLVLERSHRSSLRIGRWLGRSWASTFDQRLLVTADRVTGLFADGRVLSWPRPGEAGGQPVQPADGVTWPLRHRADGSYTVTDPRRGLTWRFAARAGYPAGGPGQDAELPLVALTDRAGHEIAYSYDAAGQPASVTHSGGYRVQVTMADGRVARLALTGRPGTGDLPLVSFAYDGDGNLAGVTNSSGRPLAYRYDPAGRLAGWTDRNRHSYRYAYDEFGRCIRAAGSALSGTFSYQPGMTRMTSQSGAVTSYAVTADAQVAAVTDPLGGTTSWERDARGRVTTRVDPLGRITRYAYDGEGNLIAVTRPDGSQAVARYADGLLAELTEPGGASWRQQHDARGQRTALTGPDGAVTRFGYDAGGHLASVTDPAGAVTRVACDPAGLPLTVTSPAGARTGYRRDPLGRVTEVTAPDGAVTRLSWTLEGRLAARVLPDGSTERWDYDGEGNLTAARTAAGAVTAYGYGPFDRLTAMTGPDGTRTEFAYDDELRLTSVLHAGLAWRYEYDPAGRLTAETDYNAATTRYSYDAAGQLASRVNAAGQQVTFRYDELGRLTGQDAAGVVTTFGYDPAGRLVAARNPDADLRFTLDPVGRVTAETCNGRTVTTAYDQAGRVIRQATPSGAEAGWEYGPDGQPSALTTGGHQVRFGYDPAGRETRRELPGGATLGQEWDQLGRLTRQLLTGSPGARPEGPAIGGQLLQQRAYRYQPDGLLTGLDDLLSGSRSIGLDQAGRVTAVTGPDWAEQYAYDQAGNLAAASWPAAPFGALDGEAQGRREVTGSLVTRAGNVRYRHDRLGRVVQRQRIRISRKPDTWYYTWDADDRLASVTTPDGTTWRYRYDPLGRRVAKERVAADGTVTARTDFSWDGPVLAEQAEAGAGAPAPDVVSWTYRPGTFTPLTQAERAPQDEIDQRFYAIVTDLVGTPAELAASDGTLAGYRVQTLWGGTAWASGGARTPLRFPGQYEDDETGLYYNHQRYYDPVSGAYLTPDPLGLAPAPNPHAYVPNPLAFIDPLGLMSCTGSTQPGSQAPPAGGLWTQTSTQSAAENAYAHYVSHGADFPDLQNSVQYVQTAQAFLRNPPPDALIKFRLGNGDKVVYQPGSEWFGVLRADGTPRTFFIPDPAEHGYATNLDYFNAS